MIVILDSMSFGQRAGTMKNLRQWLTLEAKKKRGIDIDASKAFNATYAKVTIIRLVLRWPVGLLTICSTGSQSKQLV